MRFCILRRNSRWPPKVAGNNFWEKSPVHSPDTLWVKNFVEITLSRSVSEIKAFLSFTQKFKMAAKSGGKTLFCKKLPINCAHTLWVKHFVEIALSHCISEINAFLHFTQKFKMAAKSGGKRFLGKVASTICRYPVGHKFCRNHCISLRFRDK